MLQHLLGRSCVYVNRDCYLQPDFQAQAIVTQTMPKIVHRACSDTVGRSPCQQANARVKMALGSVGLRPFRCLYQ